MVKRLASVLAVVSATWLTLALVTPAAVASAALDTADTSFPINEFTPLEVHTTANCGTGRRPTATSQRAPTCARPRGRSDSRNDLWARQTTTLRTMDK